MARAKQKSVFGEVKDFAQNLGAGYGLYKFPNQEGAEANTGNPQIGQQRPTPKPTQPPPTPTPQPDSGMGTTAPIPDDASGTNTDAGTNAADEMVNKDKDPRKKRSMQ